VSAEGIVVTEYRSEALARLDVFVGEWVIEARFPAGQPAPANANEEGPQARSWFEWALDGQFLVQRTEVPIPRTAGPTIAFPCRSLTLGQGMLERRKFKRRICRTALRPDPHLRRSAQRSGRPYYESAALTG
jgi:hypothetical protein